MNPPTTLAEGSMQYLEHLQAQGKNERTLYTYGKDIQQILGFFGSERLLSNLPLPLIGKFLKSDELLKLPNGQERAPQTVNKTIRVFRMLLAWLIQNGHMTELQLPKSIPRGRQSK